jgi:hypothetical protein
MTFSKLKPFLIITIFAISLTSFQFFNINISFAQDLDELMDDIMDKTSEEANDDIKRQVRKETMETVNEDISLQETFSGIYSIPPNAFGIGTLKSTSSCNLQFTETSVSGNCTLIDSGLAYTGTATISGTSGDGINYTFGFNITTGSLLPIPACNLPQPGTGALSVVSGMGEPGTTLSASNTVSIGACANGTVWSLIKK